MLPLVKEVTPSPDRKIKLLVDWGDHVRVKTCMFHSRELFVLS